MNSNPNSNHVRIYQNERSPNELPLSAPGAGGQDDGISGPFGRTYEQQADNPMLRYAASGGGIFMHSGSLPSL